MKKNFFKGLIIGMMIVNVVVIAFGAIYDYVPSLAQKIWPDSVKFKKIPIHEDNIFDDEIIGEIPMKYFSKTHVCEIWDGEPHMISGLFTYDFETDRWIWCQ